MSENKDFVFADPNDEDYQKIVDSLPQFSMNRAQRRATKKLSDKIKKTTEGQITDVADLAKKLTYARMIERLQEKKKEWQEDGGKDENEESN